MTRTARVAGRALPIAGRALPVAGRNRLHRVNATTAVALVFGISVALTATVGPQAMAVPDNAGTPGTPQVVYTEDFQNAPGASPILRLSQYSGVTGMTYTADPAWLRDCNGWIASADQPVAPQPQITDCAVVGGNGQSNWNTSQQLAQSIGLFHGQTEAQSQSNYAVTAYTTADPGAGNIEFQTAHNVPLVSTNRFIAFSVDVAAVNCAVAAPLLQFTVLDDSGTTSAAGAPINACDSPTTVVVPPVGAAGQNNVSVGSFTTNAAVLLSGASVGVRMVNNQGTGAGNDHTFDNVKILDVSPQLDKAFSPVAVETNDTSTLTFTVTNTSELAAKSGWGFTDTFPDGLTVADDPAIGGSCTAATVAAAGGSSIEVSSGDLAAGEVSCTITVNVTSSTAATYTNGPSNVEVTGLNPPGSSTVIFSDPSYQVAKSVSTTAAQPGDVVRYAVTVTNTGPWTYNSGAPDPWKRVSVTDDLADVLDDASYNNDASDGATLVGDTLEWSGELAAAESKTVTYSVTVNNSLHGRDSGQGNGSLINTVRPGNPRDGSCGPNGSGCIVVTVVPPQQAGSSTLAPTGSAVLPIAIGVWPLILVGWAMLCLSRRRTTT